MIIEAIKEALGCVIMFYVGSVLFTIMMIICQWGNNKK